MSLCQKCANVNCNHEIEPAEVVVQCGAFKHPMTNADKIRSMSDEELAEAIAGADWCELCDQVRQDGTCHAMELCGPLNRYCIDGCLKWLRQSAKEDDLGN